MPFVKKNRQKMTEAEKMLWEELRGKKLGIIFRRQHPIGDYIADFFAYKAKLIIEIDGAYHEEREQKEDDRIRTCRIESLGYKVIRFRNEEIYNSLNNVLKEIQEYIKSVNTI